MRYREGDSSLGDDRTLGGSDDGTPEEESLGMNGTVVVFKTLVEVDGTYGVDHSLGVAEGRRWCARFGDVAG